MARTKRTIVIALGGLMLAGCGGGGSGSTDGAGAPQPINEANLARVADCDALHDFVREDAIQQIRVQAAQLRTRGWLYAPRDDGPFVDPTGTPAAASTPVPAGGGPSHDFTDTNVQVAGVDEADIVETDGNHIYLLHDAELVVLDAFPPEATALAERVAIEGVPLGMFVAEQRALVLSQVFDTGNLGGADACRTIGLPLPAPHAFAGPSAPGVVPRCAPPFVKITLLDLTGASPRTVRELFVEGDYVSARRHGDRARVIVQRGWGLPPEIPDAWESIATPAWPTSMEELVARVDDWERVATVAIEASNLDNWLPTERERIGGAFVDLPLTCANAHVPAPGLAQHGVSLVLSLDMSVDATPVQNTIIMGAASQIYASGGTLVLASSDWIPVPTADADMRTALHVFDLPVDSLETIYRGSGFVPGSLLSQFAIDVQDDVLRVATTFVRRDTLLTVNRVTTARIAGDAVVPIGSTGDLAPGERLFAARFLGDRAYLVTFRQIDPLFVIDLSEPTQPRVLGEVELPGFSEYLQPLGDHRLLTVGHAANPEGRQLGVALRIFDVSDPTTPRLTHTQVLPGEGWTPAATNHLAFTFDARLGILALPYNRYDNVSYRSSLVLLDVDATAGFDVRGEIEHAAPAFAPCPLPFAFESCPTQVDMLRGLFIDDSVYSISTRAVQVHALNDLASPVATVLLP